jgi:hypothetical protein
MMIVNFRGFLLRIENHNWPDQETINPQCRDKSDVQRESHRPVSAQPYINTDGASQWTQECCADPRELTAVKAARSLIGHPCWVPEGATGELAGHRITWQRCSPKRIVR